MFMIVVITPTDLRDLSLRPTHGPPEALKPPLLRAASSGARNTLLSCVILHDGTNRVFL